VAATGANARPTGSGASSTTSSPTAHTSSCSATSTRANPPKARPAANLQALFHPDGPLVSCNTLDGFDVGTRPGTFDSCGIRNRLDYILLSQSLRPAFVSGQIFRKGLWGTRSTRPDRWETYEDMKTSVHQASDHAAVLIHLNL
jgi:endonuclease/exonuclease/phosphatase family metal-dependent hydrolase